MSTPLEYQNPVAPRSKGRRLFSPDAFVTMAAVTFVFVLVSQTATFKLEAMFRDFKMKLPVITEIYLTFVNLLRLPGLVTLAIVLSLFAGFLAPFLEAPADASREDARGRRRTIRRLILVFGTLLLAFAVVALVLPYSAMIENLSGGPPGGTGN